MRRLLAALMSTIAIVAVHASPKLDGTWVSSHDLTMAFANKHAKLEERTERFLDQIMGRLVVRFDGKHVASDMPDWDAEIGGERRHMTGFRESTEYKVLFANDNVVVVKGRQQVTGKEVVTVYNFVDGDTMWVYQDSADKNIPDLNIREYFVRTK